MLALGLKFACRDPRLPRSQAVSHSVTCAVDPGKGFVQADVTTVRLLGRRLFFLSASGDF